MSISSSLICPVFRAFFFRPFRYFFLRCHTPLSNGNQPPDVALRVSPAFPDLKLLSPVFHRGVACMSFGWVNAKAGVPGAGGRGAAVMRGAMVTKVCVCRDRSGYVCP